MLFRLNTLKVNRISTLFMLKSQKADKATPDIPITNFKRKQRKKYFCLAPKVVM